MSRVRNHGQMSDEPTDGVMGSLPRTRPHRRSAKRGPAAEPEPSPTAANQPAAAPPAATVKAMAEDARANRFGWTPEAANPEALPTLFSQRGVRTVTFEDWKLLDRAEIENGKRTGKIREKFTRVSEMLEALETLKRQVAA